MLNQVGRIVVNNPSPGQLTLLDYKGWVSLLLFPCLPGLHLLPTTCGWPHSPALS